LSLRPRIFINFDKRSEINSVMAIRYSGFAVCLFCLVWTGRAQKAEIDSLIQVLHLTELPSERVNILNQIAGYYSGDQPSQSKIYADQAFFIAESINAPKGKAIAQYYLAQAAMHNHEWERAISLLNLSRSEFEKLKEDYWAAKVDVSIGAHFQRRLEYEKSLTAFYNALNVFRKEKKDEETAKTLHAIGSNFFEQGNLEKAFEYYTGSLSIYEKIADSSGIGMLYNETGEIFRLKRQFPESFKYLILAAGINQRLGKPQTLITTYVNLGKLHVDLGNYDSAGYYLKTSENLSYATDNSKLLPGIMIASGKLYMHLTEYTESFQYYSEGYRLATQFSDMTGIRDASEGLSEVSAVLRNYKEAYKYHLVYKLISDSISNIRTSEMITRIEMQHLYDQQMKSDMVKRKKARMDFAIMALIVILVLISIALLYGRLRIKAKHDHSIAHNLQLEHKKLRDELDQKNRVLATNVMYMVRKNELINYISERLAGFMDNFKDENKGKIREIIVNLQSNIDKNIWTVFEERFSDVHDNFYKTLQTRFPTLTENERKLCALLRLNFNTKEIAAITHQNINAIEVARTRLRKKLNLSNTDINLNSFLATL
jgi:tetratricopeptide (TPR) repeat protein